MKFLTLLSHSDILNNQDDLNIHLEEIKKLKIYPHCILGHYFFLRPIFPWDESSIAIFKDEGAMKYFGEGKTFTEERIKEGVAKAASNNWATPLSKFQWSLLNREGDVGRIMVTFPDKSLDKLGKYDSSKEISYCIKPSQNGRGLTPSAAKLIIEYCGGKFFATVHPENFGSEKVLQEKLGFKKDTELGPVEKYGSTRIYYFYHPKDGEEDGGELGYLGSEEQSSFL